MANLSINKYSRNQWRQQAPDSVNNFIDINKNFELLNKKVAYAQKELNAWDFYKITTTITSDSEYQVKLSTLLPNTAAIVTSKISSAGIGDIFFKDSAYNIISVPAERGGIFYPSQIQKDGNNYIILFSFLDREPLEGTELVEEGTDPETEQPTWTVDTPKENIEFQGIAPSTNNTSYAETIIQPEGGWIGSVSRSLNNSIKPVIKSFTNSNEEIYWDLQYTESSGNFIITQPPNFVHHIVIK